METKQNSLTASKAKKNQTFRFAAPDATSVSLVGDFTHWQKGSIPMRKDKNGIWEATVALEPGKHSYRFIVDGEWRDDPECHVRVPNPFGGHDMIREAA
jgi:1,4-alpha-glucan branching enzyme